MSAEELPAGTKLGAYRIVAPLGRGGMGVVYEARDERLDRRVALKVVAREPARDPRFMARFRREAKAAAGVQHPGVVAVYDLGEENGLAYVVLEHMPGGSLSGRLPLPWREACRFGAQVARALEAVHGAGLVHRDVKPANVLLDARGGARLSDFGLVRQLESLSRTEDRTRSGELVGTFEYLSPEQADGGGAKIDGRADLYSLGATIHALVAGAPPFQGVGYSLVKQHLTDAPPPLRTLVPEVPAELERLVLSLLEKAPAQRPASAGAVALALDEIARDDERGASRPRPRVAIAAGTVAAACLVGLGVVAARQPWGAPAPTPTPASPKPTPTPARPSPAPTPLPTPAPSPTAAERLWSGTHGGKVCAAAFSPDASLAVTASASLETPGEEDNTLKLWSVSDGRALGLGRGHGDAIWSVKFSPDGQRLLSASYDGTIKLWDGRALANGPTRTFLANAGNALSVAFAPDGKRALAGYGDGTMRLWDLSNESEPLCRFVGAAGGVTGVAFLPGTRVVAVDGGGSLSLWEVPAGRRDGVRPTRQTPIADAVLQDLAVSPDGSRALTANWLAGTATLFDLERGVPQSTMGGFSLHVRNVALSSDGRRALGGSLDLGIKVWELGTERVLAEPRKGSVASNAVFGFSSDGHRAISGEDRTGAVTLWELP